jgi:hypothetical protein
LHIRFEVEGEKDFIFGDQGASTVWRGTLAMLGFLSGSPPCGLTPETGFGPKVEEA